jgi:hypothetical protein
MLSFAADFWPVFWTILSVGAVVTVALCFTVAVISLPETRRHHQPPVRLHLHRTAQTPSRADHLPHAA